MAAGTKGPDDGRFAVARTVIWAALAACFLGLLLRSMDTSSVTGIVRLPSTVSINTPASSSSAGGATQAPAAVAAPSAPLAQHEEHHDAHHDAELTHLDLDALEAGGDGEDDETPWAALALAAASAPASSGASGAPAAAAKSAPAAVVKAPSAAAADGHEHHTVDFEDLESGGKGDDHGSEEPPMDALAVAAKSAAAAAAPQAPLVANSSDSGCAATPEFLEYQPSAWEHEWFKNAAKFQEQPELVCQTMLAELDKVDAWLDVTDKAQVPSLDKEPDHAIFSRFKYRDPCTSKEFFAYIEPVVGHFRHPRMPLPCHPGQGKKVVGIEDRSYVMLQGGQQQYSRSGKAYLFDLGTAKFKTSVGWMLEHYGAIGVQFNEIWAWEIKIQEPNEYWGTVPPKVQPRLHFYNIPVSVAPKDPANPLSTLKEIHRPGDYTVIKLDIDNSKLELALIYQIENDPQLPVLISDIMFEMHYDHPDMARYFGMNNQKTWLDVITKFRELRSKGLRVHYWP